VENLENISILYVEDEIGTRENLLFYLENSFKKVLTAGNGVEALEVFKSEPNIDLVITDINMPVMNGLDMIKKIKDINLNTKFLITTAYNNQEYLLEAIDLGVISYIVKPVDVNLLFKKIKFTYKNIFEKKSLDILSEKMSTLKSLNMEQFSQALDKVLMEITQKNTFNLYNNYIYDFNNKYIIKDNQVISLNNQEIKTMELLIKNKDMISYDTLTTYISPENPSIDLLRTVIKSIRKKTDKNIILNLSGFGYKINTNV